MDNLSSTCPAETSEAGSAKHYPLTSTQKGLLADSLVVADKGVNVEQIVWEFENAPGTKQLQTAWQETLDAFDALRLQFHWPESGDPWQEVVAKVELPFRVIEWSTLTGGESLSLQRVLAEDRRAGFDLFGVPLCRVSVIRMGRNRAICIWTIHHAIIDGGCYATVLEHVRARLELRSVSPHVPTIGFTHFLEWLQSYDMRPGIEYYARLLKGLEAQTLLPFQEGSTNHAEGYALSAHSKVAQSLTEELLARAKREQVSLNTIVQLAWGLLLGRYACTDDVTFGGTWSGRPGTIENAKSVVGPFINTLPVRVRLRPNDTMRSALHALREQHIHSRPFHHTPLPRIRAACDMAHVANLFGSIVVFEHERFYSTLRRSEPRWEGARLWSRSQPNYPLALAACVAGGRIELELQYDVALYDTASAGQLLADYNRILEAFASSLDQNIATVRVHDPQTYARLTVAEAERECVPHRPCPVQVILETAERCCDRTAIYEIGGGDISYVELAGRVRALAAVLVARGVKRGSLVAVLIPRSIQAIVSMLAVQAVGGCYVPLDPSNPAKRLNYVLGDCRACLVLVDSETQGILERASGRELNVEDADAMRASLPGEGLRAESFDSTLSQPSDHAYVIYTSGSTGEPKGVSVSHSALANHMAAVISLFGLTEQDRVLQFSAMGFDVSLEEIIPTLAIGATLYLRSAEMTASARDFFQAVQKAELTLLNLPTAFWHQLVRGEQEWPASVRLLVIGGERACPEAWREFRKAATKHVRLINAYGPTEATITSTCYDDIEGPGEADLPIGRPLAGVSHFVLDQQLEPVPLGAIGQLYIGGAGLAEGYLNREELTAQRFLSHPWRNGARLYATGDRVRLAPGGNYVYVDRVDNQVKLRGFRIELGEIESRLRSHPAVQDAVAVVHHPPDREPTLVAFVAVIPRKTTGELLREHVGATLPYYMVPSQILLLDRLPTNASGKVDRLTLATTFLEEPVCAEPIPSTTDPLLRGLLQIWSDVLDKPVTETSNSFFALGGHSLLVVRMFSEIEKRFGRTCSTAAFFKTPTVSALAGLLRDSKGADWKAPVLQLAAGTPHVRPLFFAPGVFGRASDFVHLAKVLHSDIPLYALQIRGLSRSDTPHETLRAAAAEYADRIQSIQVVGPYAVSGFSAGGVIAMAIAQELHRRGEKTDFVGLIDSVPPTTVPIPSPFSSPRRALRMLRTTMGRVKESVEAHHSAGQLLRHSVAALRRVASRWSLTSKKYVATVGELFEGASFELAPEEAELIENHLHVILSHELDIMPIDIVLMRTRLDPFEGPHEPELGWQRVTTGRIKIHFLDGLHSGILTSEGAPEVATLMELYLLARRVAAFR